MPSKVKPQKSNKETHSYFIHRNLILNLGSKSQEPRPLMAPLMFTYIPKKGTSTATGSGAAPGAPAAQPRGRAQLPARKKNSKSTHDPLDASTPASPPSAKANARATQSVSPCHSVYSTSPSFSATFATRLHAACKRGTRKPWYALSLLQVLLTGAQRAADIAHCRAGILVGASACASC